MSRFVRKSKDYGNVFYDLGLKGQYSDMHRKMVKIRKALWDGEELVGEQADEILTDLVGNILISLFLLMTQGERNIATEESTRLGGQATPDEEYPILLTFAKLREQNTKRLVRWHGEADAWTGSDWTNAMAGETGEACNIVKKLRRHETGTGTQYNTPPIEELLPALAEELADIVTYADLVAHYFNIDLEKAVVEKFNKVSAIQSFPERL